MFLFRFVLNIISIINILYHRQTGVTLLDIHDSCYVEEIMKNSQYLTKNTMTILLVALFVLVASMSMVAYADEHQNVVEYDVDELGTVDVPYNSLVQVTGSSINEGDTYVLYDMNDDRTTVTATADAEGMVEFDTSELGDGYNPTGDWSIQALEEGEVVVDSPQVTDDTTVIVDEARANVDYMVSVHEVDSSGEPDIENNIGSEQFDAGDEILDFEMTIDALADGEHDVVVALTEVGASVESTDDLLDFTAVTLDVDETNTVSGANTLNENEFPRESYDFSIVAALSTNDDRVVLDAFDNTDEDSSIARVWVGQQLVLAGDDLDDEATYDLIREDGDGDETLVREITPVVSDTTNTHEFNIDSSFPNADVDAEGDFKIVGPSGTEVQWNAVQQDLNAELNESVVNLHTDNTQVDLNVTSIRSGPYDVLVESDGVDAEELADLVDESQLPSDSYVYVEDASDDDNEQVRITNVRTSGENVFTVPLEFDNTNEQEYEFSLEVADANAEATTGELNVAFFDEGEARFSQGTYVQEQGDMVTFEIDMSDTSVTTLKFLDSDYELEFDVVDSDNSGSAEITMDTYRAGDKNDGYTFEDVFTAGEGTEIDDSPTLPSVSGPFSTGLYTMELEVNNRDTDMGTLFILDRQSEDINTWVMPMDKSPTMSNLEEYGTQQDRVALQDKFVVEVEASGLYSSTLLTEDVTGADLVDAYDRDDFDTSTANNFLSEIGLNIVQSENDRNAAKTFLKLEEAENVEIVPEENSFYVFFNTGNDDIYDTYDSESDVNKETEFDIELNITEDYKYVEDSDDTSANLYESFDLVERTIVTNLPSVVVDEETLETKHGLTAVENSTVSGYTHIAPYTTGIDVIVRTEDSQQHAIESEFFSERVEVTEEGTVSAEFDLSNFEIDRAMELKFRPVDSDYREAVIIEEAAPPEITRFDSDDTPVTAGNEVGFNLEVESDDNDALNYNWDFGDDEGTSAQSSPSYVYDEAGTYEVSVTVSDSSGQSDTATTEIVVEEAPNEPPTIDQIISPEEAEVGDNVMFTVIAFDDVDSTRDLQYAWDFDDGSTGTGISATNSFSEEGTYDVSVTVTDTGGESTTESAVIQVTDPSADDDDDGPYDLTITAEDSETNELIPGVSITISQDGETIETVTTDGDGASVVELENGEYDIEASVDGYETRTSGTLIDGEDNELRLEMVFEDGNGDDPSQPGFGVILAAIALIAGSMVAYRRKD